MIFKNIAHDFAHLLFNNVLWAAFASIKKDSVDVYANYITTQQYNLKIKLYCTYKFLIYRKCQTTNLESLQKYFCPHRIFNV